MDITTWLKPLSVFEAFHFPDARGWHEDMPKLAQAIQALIKLKVPQVERVSVNVHWLQFKHGRLYTGPMPKWDRQYPFQKR